MVDQDQGRKSHCQSPNQHLLHEVQHEPQEAVWSPRKRRLVGEGDEEKAELLDNHIFYFSTIWDALAVVTNGHKLLLFSLCINLILHSLMVRATHMHYKIVDYTILPLQYPSHPAYCDSSFQSSSTSCDFLKTFQSKPLKSCIMFQPELLDMAMYRLNKFLVQIHWHPPSLYQLTCNLFENSNLVICIFFKYYLKLQI
jgi:hypothetical protein